MIDNATLSTDAARPDGRRALTPTVMRVARVGVIALSAALLPAAAAGFGARGHEVIGAIADRLLSPQATRHRDQLVGMTLQAAATWADCVRNVEPDAAGWRYRVEPGQRLACERFETPSGLPRMIDYVQRNWRGCAARATACHRTYHYTDVAIQNDRYDRRFHGTRDDDVVGAIRAAIAVLQGRPAPAPFSIRDEAEAVLLLAHFVGDVHQPLHVGAIYLDADGRPVDPDDAAGNPAAFSDTRGGNSIDVGPTDLHAEWDRVAAPMSVSIGVPMLAAARAVESSPGSPGSWPVIWASETVRVARRAYAGIDFIPEETGHDRRWHARFADRAAYRHDREQIQSEQLARAGARLAQLLNAIWR
ncbi:MAG: S1/P1 nuclease [Burkholderiaceae bacterium]